MCVDKYEEHVTTKRACEVEMDSALWLVRPFPGVKWGRCRCWTRFLTYWASFHQLLDVCVHSRPPNVGSGERLHLTSPGVCLMKLIQKQLSARWRNDDTGCPEETSIEDTSFLRSRVWYSLSSF